MRDLLYKQHCKNSPEHCRNTCSTHCTRDEVFGNITTTYPRGRCFPPLLPHAPALKAQGSFCLLAPGVMLSAQRMLHCSSGCSQHHIYQGRDARYKSCWAGTELGCNGAIRLRALERGRAAYKALRWPRAMGDAVSLLVGQTLPASASLSFVFSSPRENTKPTHRRNNSGCTHLFASSYFKALHHSTVSPSNPSFIRQG